MKLRGLGPGVVHWLARACAVMGLLVLLGTPVARAEWANGAVGVPKDASVAVFLNDLDTELPRIVALLERIQGHVPTLLQVPGLRELFKNKLGFDPLAPADLQTLGLDTSRPVVFYLGPISGAGIPPMALLLPLKDRAAFQATVRRLVTEALGEQLTESAEPDDIVVLQPSVAEFTIAVMPDRAYLVPVELERTAFLAQLAGYRSMVAEGQTLDENETFKRSAEKLRPDATLSVYVNLPPLVELAYQMLLSLFLPGPTVPQHDMPALPSQEEGGPDVPQPTEPGAPQEAQPEVQPDQPGVPQPEQPLDTNALLAREVERFRSKAAGMQGLLYQFTIQENGLGEDLFLALTPELATQLREYLVPGRIVDFPPTRYAGQAPLYGVLSFDVAKLWGKLAALPFIALPWSQIKAETLREIGLDLDKDLIEQFDGRFAYGIIGMARPLPEKRIRRYADPPELFLQLLQHAVFVGVRDPAAARAAVAKFAQGINADEHEQIFAQEQRGGVEVWKVVADDSDLPPWEMAVVGNVFVLALGPHTLDKVLADFATERAPLELEPEMVLAGAFRMDALLQAWDSTGITLLTHGLDRPWQEITAIMLVARPFLQLLDTWAGAGSIQDDGAVFKEEFLIK